MTPSTAYEAAFQVENSTSALADLLTRPEYKYDPDHNPLDVIAGTKYENGDLWPFVESYNETNTRDIMARIDREETAAAILAEADGSPSFAYQPEGYPSVAVTSTITLVVAAALLGGAVLVTYSFARRVDWSRFWVVRMFRLWAKGTDRSARDWPNRIERHLRERAGEEPPAGERRD